MIDSPATKATGTVAPEHRPLVTRLLLLVAVSFAFGFALVPLYDAFCEATGLNGKTGGAPPRSPDDLTARSAAPARIDASRTLTVEFMGTVMPGLPWEMTPVTQRLELHPGEAHQALYRVRNLSDKPIVGQAVPSVSPGLAARHFEKIDCFCFTQQTLAAGETRELPVSFIVKPEIDPDIRTITLAYAFFNTAETPPGTAKLTENRVLNGENGAEGRVKTN